MAQSAASAAASAQKRDGSKAERSNSMSAADLTAANALQALFQVASQQSTVPAASAQSPGPASAVASQMKASTVQNASNRSPLISQAHLAPINAGSPANRLGTRLLANVGVSAGAHVGAGAGASARGAGVGAGAGASAGAGADINGGGSARINVASTVNTGQLAAAGARSAVVSAAGSPAPATGSPSAAALSMGAMARTGPTGGAAVRNGSLPTGLDLPKGFDVASLASFGAAGLPLALEQQLRTLPLDLADTSSHQVKADKLERRRQLNRETAKRSRIRQKLFLQYLEQRVKKLEDENSKMATTLVQELTDRGQRIVDRCHVPLPPAVVPPPETAPVGAEYPPINPDAPGSGCSMRDKLERNRERNRENSKRTRMRKKIYMESLQEKVRALEQQNTQTKSAIMSLEAAVATKLLQKVGFDLSSTAQVNPMDSMMGPNGMGPPFSSGDIPDDGTTCLTPSREYTVTLCKDVGGDASGYGFELGMQDGLLRVTNFVKKADGTPGAAEQSTKVSLGDVLVTVNGQPATAEGTTDCAAALASMRKRLRESVGAQVFGFVVLTQVSRAAAAAAASASAAGSDMANSKDAQQGAQPSTNVSNIVGGVSVPPPNMAVGMPGNVTAQGTFEPTPAAAASAAGAVGGGANPMTAAMLAQAGSVAGANANALLYHMGVPMPGSAGAPANAPLGTVLNSLNPMLMAQAQQELGAMQAQMQLASDGSKADSATAIAARVTTSTGTNVDATTKVKAEPESNTDSEATSGTKRASSDALAKPAAKKSRAS